MILLDPGHPSRQGDAGVIVPGGSEKGEDFREVDYVYERVQNLGVVLTGWGVGWDLTRGKDEVMSLRERGKFGAQRGAKFALSIHVDSHPDPVFHGMRVFHRPGNPKAKDIAGVIHRAIPEPLQFFRKTTQTSREDWTRRADNVLREHQCPAVLVECGFASNPEDLALLQTYPVIRGIETAMLCGIARALDIT